MTAVSTSRSRTVVERCRRQTLTGAKALFMKAVREGVENLMQRYGYSRDRATTTLLRELARGETGPTEDEVSRFQTKWRKFFFQIGFFPICLPCFICVYYRCFT